MAVQNDGTEISFDPVLNVTVDASFNGASSTTGITTVIDPDGNALPNRENIQFIGTGVQSVTVTGDRTVVNIAGGTTGTTDYNDLENKPTLDGTVIQGTMTTSGLGLATVSGLTNGTIVVKTAVNSTNADYALDANHATSADSATSATTATNYNTTSGTIKTAIDNLNTGLAGKASTTTVSALDTRVTTNTNNISTINSTLDTKADKTTVNTLSGKVDSNTSDIATLNTTVAGKADGLNINSNKLQLKSGDTLIGNVVILPGEGSGSSDYNDLNNKPTLNGVEIVGTQTSSDFGIANVTDITNGTIVAKEATNAVNASNYATGGTIETVLGTKQDKTDNSLTTTSKTVVGAINEVSGVANEAYSSTNVPPYPVTSVNTKTGDVVLNATDVNALPNTTTYVSSVDGNSGIITTNGVKFVAQTLTDTQKTQARTNIGAGTSNFTGAYSDLSGKPTIPSKTSDLTNDSGYITATQAPVQSVNGQTGTVSVGVSDLSDTTIATPTNGQVLAYNGTGWVNEDPQSYSQQQVNWNETDTASVQYIQNKPTKVSSFTNDSGYVTATTAPVKSVNTKTGAVVLTQDDVGNGATYVRTTNDYTTADKTKLAGIASGAEVNVINTVKQNGTALTITDKAVNVTVPTTASDINAEPAFTKNTAFNKNFETATANIKMDGTVSVGTTSTVARADHIHPTDTTRASVTALNSEISDRQSADTTLQSNIDAKASQADLNAEITNRTNADNELNVQIQNLSYQNQWIGSVATCATGSEQTVLTQYVVDTVSRQPRQGDEVTITDRGEIWLYNSAGTWVYFASTDQVVDATTDNKGVVQIGSGINVSGGVISVTKSLIGLGNVDNTSDANKPVSTATQIALNLKQNITDSTLNTTAKTVVGAINENKSNIDSNTANIGTINTSLASKYGTDNEPPYPVTSVNSKTGAVTLTASDVSALPASTTYVSSVDGNSGSVTLNDVKYTTQSLTTTQQAQARSNIGAGTSSFSGAYGDLTGTPTIPSRTSDLTNDSGFQTATQVNSAISTATADMATTDTAQTISGAKTFSTAPTVSATIASGDNSTKVGTTAWVTSKLASYATASDLTAGLAGKQDSLTAGTNIAIVSNTISVTGTVPNATNAVTSESCTGNAATATSVGKLTTARTIGISGGATGTATEFDGSANITIPVTSLDATKLSGTASISTTGNASTATVATNYYIDASTSASIKTAINSKMDTDKYDPNGDGVVNFAVEASRAGDAEGYTSDGAIASALDNKADATAMASALALKADKSNSAVIVSIPVSSWDSTAQTATIDVANVTATSNNEILPLLATSADNITNNEALQAAGLQDAGQSAGKITLYATSIPTVAISIRVIVRGDA